MSWQGDLDDELTCSRLNFSLLPPKHILFKDQMHDQDTLDMAKFLSPTCKTAWTYAHVRRMYTIERGASLRRVGIAETTTETICNFNILRNCMFFSNFAHYLGIQNNFI